MLIFIGGMADGVSLACKRAPIMLRVVMRFEKFVSKWDALDQLGDEPAKGETAHVYIQLGSVGSVHIDPGGFYPVACYAYLSEQPSSERLVGKAWQEWCDSHREHLMAVKERLDHYGLAAYKALNDAQRKIIQDTPPPPQRIGWVMSTGKRCRTPPSGKWRRKAIRQAARVRTVGELTATCCAARERFGYFKSSLGRGHALTRWSFSLWHDREYALSLKLGYYDEKSEAFKHTMRMVREKHGREMLPCELRLELTRIMARLAPIFAEHDTPIELGVAIRMFNIDRLKG